MYGVPSGGRHSVSFLGDSETNRGGSSMGAEWGGAVPTALNATVEFGVERVRGALPDCAALLFTRSTSTRVARLCFFPSRVFVEVQGPGIGAVRLGGEQRVQTLVVNRARRATALKANAGTSNLLKPNPASAPEVRAKPTRCT